MNRGKRSDESLTELRKDSVSAPSKSPDRLRFDALLEQATEASLQGEFPKALRNVDRLWRQSKANYLVGQFLGKLLLASRQFGSALDHFCDLTESWPLPDNEAGYIEAMLGLGDISAASSRLSVALNRFAVSPDGRLALAAGKVLHAQPTRRLAWLALDPELRLIGQFKGIPSAGGMELRAGDRQVFAVNPSSIDAGGIGEFRLETPVLSSHTTLSLYVEGSSISNQITVPPDFALDGRATTEVACVKGWASLGWRPETPIDVEIEDQSGSKVRVPTKRDPHNPAHWLFELDLALTRISGNNLIISASWPDGSSTPLPDSPFLRSISPPLPALPRRFAKGIRKAAATSSRKISVVVPVYQGLAETIDCLDSLIATCRGLAEIVVVDDASPDPRLAARLDHYREQGLITLLRNETNLGFSGACNRAILLDKKSDVVLLNSDSVVYDGWLERLRAAAYGAHDIGTVTPLTNWGSIASYPAGVEQSCTNSAGAEIDALAASVNAGRTAELPVGVGFCLYMRRDCLNEIGLLDADAFPSGYGEEVDFCLRANRRGWRHLLAGDVFVRHIGNRSFGSRRAALMDRGNRIIQSRYPDFQLQIEQFQQSRALAALRRPLDELRLRSAAKPYVLLITLALGGGVERFVNERCKAIEDQGFIPLVLRPKEAASSVCMLGVGRDTHSDLSYDMPHEMGLLRDGLAGLKFAAVELHCFLDLSPDLVDEVFTLSAPVDIYIHDYSWICPRITLVDGSRQYCGEPAVDVCERCVAANGSRLAPISVSGLRARSEHWLSRARQVIVSTKDVQRRIARYFPSLETTIQPWQTDAKLVPRKIDSRSATDEVRVALIGGIGIHKGYDILLNCAKDAAARHMPIEFVVLGYTEDDEALLATGKVFITGRYDEPEINRLIEREAPDLAVFLSVCPEVWCYALTCAMQAGLAVAGYDLGAIAERLRGYDRGVILPLGGDVAMLNDAMLELGRQSRICAPRITLPDSLERDSFPKEQPMDAPITVTATVQLLPISDGLYAFSVRSASPVRMPATDNLLLPAIHVGPGPGMSAEPVLFLTGPQTQGHWLCNAGDTVIVRVTGSVTMLLTSVQAPGCKPLEIEVQKLDGQPVAAAPKVSWRSGIPLDIKLHLRNEGDQAFDNTDWAGRIGTGNWIESISLAARDRLGPHDLQYKALTASGLETPWLPAGAECGTRGKGLPLVGFAIRSRDDPALASFDCEYRGYFGSGAIIGPLKNGTPCRSTRQNDPLEAIQVRMIERSAAVEANPIEYSDGTVGPRFSKLREQEPVASLSRGDGTSQPASVPQTEPLPTVARRLANARPRAAVLPSEVAARINGETTGSAASNAASVHVQSRRVAGPRL